VLNNRLSYWAENYNVYVDAQASFKTGHSTVDTIFILHGIISHYLNCNKALYCTFSYFSKAFDYVTIDNLWLKLIKLGVRVVKIMLNRELQ